MSETKSGLVFSPTPHCCGKELGHGWPDIECSICHTIYNADDVLEAMMEYRDGATTLPTIRTRPGAR